jgi:hypothetical protein
MARRMRGEAWRPIVAVALLLAVIGGLWLAWGDYRDRHTPTTAPVEPGQPTAQPVTQIVTARLSGMGDLRVARLSGIVQATSRDERLGGFLKSGQVVKMPYSVDYHVDLSALRARDLQWDPESRTLIVDAPDVGADRANLDEGAASVVQRSGILVTRTAGEALAKRASVAADGAAQREATSPERMAQAREMARAAVARTLRAPLAAAGIGDARVVVTFPAERGGRDGERWDRSLTPEQAIANAR